MTARLATSEFLSGVSITELTCHSKCFWACFRGVCGDWTDASGVYL